MNEMYTVVIVTDDTIFTWMCYGTPEEAEREARLFAQAQQFKNPVFVTKKGILTY